MVTTETEMRDYPTGRTKEERMDRMTSVVKKILLPAAGVWTCPNYFRAREVSFNSAQGGIASLRILLSKDAGYDTIWLVPGVKHTMEAAEIDIDAGTATDIVVYA